MVKYIFKYIFNFLINYIMKIITTTELQKNIWSISKDIDTNNYTIVNRWKPRMIMLPYFENNEDFVDDYLEEYEIRKNKVKLQKEMQDSMNSGLSDLVI